MKNLINNVFLVSGFAILLASCKPELTTLTATKGSLNLTSYVAIGNSLTSGFQNNGLSYSGQQSSYVNVLANQFRLVEPNLVFNTPFVGANSVGCGAPNISINPPFPSLAGGFAALAPYAGTTFTVIIGVPAPYSLQTVTTCSVASLAPAAAALHGDASIMFDPSTTGYNAQTDSIVLTFTGASLIGGFPAIKTAPSIYAASGPFQNMGVPGARAIDVNRKNFGGDTLITVNTSNFSFTQANPFFSRFAKDKTNSSMLSDAMIMKPTFFTLFIGNNDVLLWALQGGTSGVGSSTITPTPEFGDSINSILKTLTTTAKQGVIINVPQITGSAFFTYHTPDPSKYLIDETGATRPMTTSDMILLTVPNDSLGCGLAGFGTQAYPIPKKYTLTANQVAQATAAIDGYNDSLQAAATRYDLAFFDFNSFTKANQTGSTYNGMNLTSTFVTGGIFSLDGLHLTPRGYAAVANELVAVINKRYGSTLPGIDLTKYNGVTFPE